MQHVPTRICVVDSDHWKVPPIPKTVVCKPAWRRACLITATAGASDQEAHEAAVLQPRRSSYHYLGWVSLRRVEGLTAIARAEPAIYVARLRMGIVQYSSISGEPNGFA